MHDKTTQISVKVPGWGFAPVWGRRSMSVARVRVTVRKQRGVSHPEYLLTGRVLFICSHIQTRSSDLTGICFCLKVCLRDLSHSEHVHAGFCVCVSVCVYACGGTTLIIILVNTHMSTYWSRYQWAMKYLRQRRALWICLDFSWDHTVRSSIAELPPGQDYWHYWQLDSLQAPSNTQ